MAVHTVYELRVLTRLAGQEFASVERFDELERSTAEQRYRERSSKARSLIGRDHEMTTHVGNTASGRVTRMLVELVQRKQGDGWSLSPEEVTGHGGEPLSILLEADPGDEG